jgi:hypothetical protein
MSTHRTGRTVVLAIVGVFGLFSLGITGWIVWDVTSGHGMVFSAGDKSANAKCNGLDKLVRPTTGTIPTAYQLIDKRYVCRGLRGNTPQRVTQITYTYAAAPQTAQSKEPLRGYLDAELGKGGWAAPGVETINSEITSLHLTKAPLVGLSYRVVPSPTPIFQLVVFARDQWQPATQDERQPQAVVISDATVRSYNPSEHVPTFVPTGYAGWHRAPYQRADDEFDTRSLTSTTYKLAGGNGKVNIEVRLSPASADNMKQSCGGDQCVEGGKNTEGKAIFSANAGNTIYSQLGATFVAIDQATKYPGKPQASFDAGLKILASMQPAK